MKSVRIRVKLLGVLREQTPSGAELRLSEHATVEDALAAMGIGRGYVQAVAVNGVLEHDHRRRLCKDDELTVLPPVSGGC